MYRQPAAQLQLPPRSASLQPTPPLPQRPTSAHPMSSSNSTISVGEIYPHAPRALPDGPPVPERPKSAYAAPVPGFGYAQRGSADVVLSTYGVDGLRIRPSSSLGGTSPRQGWGALHAFSIGDQAGGQQYGCTSTPDPTPPSWCASTSTQLTSTQAGSRIQPPMDGSNSLDNPSAQPWAGPAPTSPRPLPTPTPYSPRNNTLPSIASTMSGQTTAHSSLPSSSSVSSVSTANAPPITYPFPTLDSLRATSDILPTLPDSDKIAWAQDVIRLLEHHMFPSGQPTDFCADQPSPTGSIPRGLQQLLEGAVPVVISFATHQNLGVGALASYLKAKLLASGAAADFLPRDPRQAFKEFETAARAGEVRGWFRLGRDYEGIGDIVRAKDCFDRGVKKQDCESTYRMGMAHLLGQLRLSPNPSAALPLLTQAAVGSSIDAPHPSYVYGMLLAGELVLPTSIPSIPPQLLCPPGSTEGSQLDLARQAIERAAYLCHPPAQYKMGYLYEHAAWGMAFDPLISVQWYSLASQGGEAEADMALSKWFLCGAEGHFGKNEDLARTFAEKCGRKGHPNGCFAMGYYFELGIGGRKDVDQARKWYQRAAKLNNADAINRLQALSSNAAPISMAEHQTRLNDTLVRKRTDAKMRSDRIGRRPRREREEQRARIEADRAARLAAGQGQPQAQAMGPQQGQPGPNWSTEPISSGPGPGPEQGPVMSPAPRVGGIISPGVFHPDFGLNNGSFPRPPIPHHAWSGDQSPLAPRGGSGERRDSPDAEQKRLEAERRRREREDKGPQTFAEMGFASKPVEDEGCCIM